MLKSYREDMKETKKDTFIWEGLGFPIRLINVPMKKVFGEWVLDINLELFQKGVLHTLACKKSPLSGSELRFIIDYLKMSTREFAHLFGVTHAAVCVHLHVLNHLKIADKEFRRLYLKISPQNLADAENDKTPLEIDAQKIAC